MLYENTYYPNEEDFVLTRFDMNTPDGSNVRMVDGIYTSSVLIIVIEEADKKYIQIHNSKMGTYPLISITNSYVNSYTVVETSNNGTLVYVVFDTSYPYFEIDYELQVKQVKDGTIITEKSITTNNCASVMKATA